VSRLRNILKRVLPSQLAIRKLPRSAHHCALLTFDDGPHPEVTPEVLDRLDRFQARAVFFVVGHRIVLAPWLLKEILARGHLLDNHSFLHANGRQLAFLEYRRDVLNCQRAIYQQCGYEPRLFRPPYGVMSFPSLFAPRTAKLRVVTWTLDIEDWRCRSKEEASRLGERLGQRVEPRDIILLHDDNPSVLEILDVALPIVAERRIDLGGGLGTLECKGERGVRR